MPQRNPITLFLLRFVILYVILVLPWPGSGGIYSAGFRAAGRAIFAGGSGPRELSFEPLGETRHPSGVRIVIVNRTLMHADGSGPVRNLDLDTLEFGWRPTALLIALVLATPIPWRRRWRALLWGLLWMHAIILLFLWFCIWNDSREVSLVTLTPFWKHAANGLRDLMVWQYNLAIPVVIWVLVAFRIEDWSGSRAVSLSRNAKKGGDAALEESAAEMKKQPDKVK